VKAYLNVGGAERGDAVNFGSRYSWWLQGQHRLEIILQFRYGGWHAFTARFVSA